MRHYRHLIVALLALFLSLFMWVGQVEATDGLTGDECVVEADEVIVEDFYFLCNTLVIYGYVDGDVIGAASEVTIAHDGRVTGGIWTIGGQLTIEGIVQEDVHFLGADLDITGLARFPNPRTDVVAAGISVEISPQALIPGDLIYFGYQAIVDGRVNGNIDFQGQSLLIRNIVGGDVDAIVGDQGGNRPLSSLPLVYSVDFRQPGLYFTLGEAEGYINGDLRYEAPQRITTRRYVGGRTTYIQSIAQGSLPEAEQRDTFLQIFGNYILRTAQDVAALGLVGVMMLNIFSASITESGYRVQTRPMTAFSWGLILFLASIPIALLLILASLLVVLLTAIITLSELTVMVGVIMLVLDLGILGGFFFLFWYLGRAVTGFVIGFLVLRLVQRVWSRYNQSSPAALREIWLAVFLGVLLVSLVVNMPLGAVVAQVQFLLSIVAASAGVGAFFMYLRDVWYEGERRIFSRRQAGPTRQRRAIPPPPDDSDDALDVPLGMDNLPSGFRGFED